MEKKWSQHVPLSTTWLAFQKETKEEIDVFFFFHEPEAVLPRLSLDARPGVLATCYLLPYRLLLWQFTAPVFPQRCSTVAVGEVVTMWMEYICLPLVYIASNAVVPYKCIYFLFYASLPK